MYLYMYMAIVWTKPNYTKLINNGGFECCLVQTLVVWQKLSASFRLPLFSVLGIVCIPRLHFSPVITMLVYIKIVKLNEKYWIWRVKQLNAAINLYCNL